MEELKNIWKEKIKSALKSAAEEYGVNPEEVDGVVFIMETPPKPELGDIAFPLFPFAKIFRKSPVQIASAVAEILEKETSEGDVAAAGPYINIKLDLSGHISKTVKQINTEKEGYGRTGVLINKKIMVEFSCPNTNKPLHLGHLRNDAIGESVSRILAMNGADVKKVNLINDRGIHICKSMLAYKNSEIIRLLKARD